MGEAVEIQENENDPSLYLISTKNQEIPCFKEGTGRSFGVTNRTNRWELGGLKYQVAEQVSDRLRKDKVYVDNELFIIGSM